MAQRPHRFHHLVQNVVGALLGLLTLARLTPWCVSLNSLSLRLIECPSGTGHDYDSITRR